MNITVHSARGARLFNFSGDSKVADVVKEAVRAFGFPATQPYGLLLSCNTSTPLRSDQSLASYDIGDGLTFFLTMTGCDALEGDYGGTIHPDTQSCERQEGGEFEQVLTASSTK